MLYSVTYMYLSGFSRNATAQRNDHTHVRYWGSCLSLLPLQPEGPTPDPPSLDMTDLVSPLHRLAARGDTHSPCEYQSGFWLVNCHQCKCHLCCKSVIHACARIPAALSTYFHKWLQLLGSLQVHAVL